MENKNFLYDNVREALGWDFETPEELVEWLAETYNATADDLLFMSEDPEFAGFTGQQAKDWSQAVKRHFGKEYGLFDFVEPTGNKWEPWKFKKSPEIMAHFEMRADYSGDVSDFLDEAREVAHDFIQEGSNFDDPDLLQLLTETGHLPLSFEEWNGTPDFAGVVYNAFYAFVLDFLRYNLGVSE